MIIKVAYYGYRRKDGSYNQVVFDTEHKTYCNWDGGYTKGATLIEAHISKDVDMLRRQLNNEGYVMIK